MLFKRFADIDVFDIELNTHNAEEVIKTCQLLEPTFGGLNLEDIKAPECFYIDETLKKTMNIPVFHDDQHGTAIISGAALVNALELVGKKTDEVADATVNVEPTAEHLAEIALCTAQEAHRFDVEPRVAMLSFSNFGSTRHPLVQQGPSRRRNGALRRPDIDD